MPICGHILLQLVQCYVFPALKCFHSWLGQTVVFKAAARPAIIGSINYRLKFEGLKFGLTNAPAYFHLPGMENDCAVKANSHEQIFCLRGST